MMCQVCGSSRSARSVPGALGAECVSVRVLVAGTRGWYNLILAGYWMWKVLTELTVVGVGERETQYDKFLSPVMMST